MNERDIIVIGGGASGIFFAINMKKKNPSCSVLLLEEKEKIGKKLLQTGNGKCNLSNENMNFSYYNDKDFIIKCMEKFSLEDEETFYNSLGLFLKTDKEGRIYPYSEMSSSVLNVLLSEIERLGIEVISSFRVNKIEHKELYYVYSNSNYFKSKRVVISTGSIAQNKTNGYELLEDLGHTKTKLSPSLTYFKTKRNLSHLNGIRIKCLGKIQKNNIVIYLEKGEVLFKEKGLSGILSMNLSRYYEKDFNVVLDLIPDVSFERFHYFMNINKSKSLESILCGMFPKMIAYDINNYLVREHFNNLQEEDIYNYLKNYVFEIESLFDFTHCQVTKGGIKLNEINEFFESKIHNGLYILGEVLNVDGACGGYNLHFALMSAVIASNNINSKN